MLIKDLTYDQLKAIKKAIQIISQRSVSLAKDDFTVNQLNQILEMYQESRDYVEKTYSLSQSLK